MSKTAESSKILLSELEGKWYINLSNFPMWLKGDKTSPTFNYSILEEEDEPWLYDEVKFIKNGKEKSIDGYDKPTNSNNTAFVWRGKGLMYLLKSKWKILYFDRSQQWAIIYFEKTLFTPGGYDVISKSKTLDKSTLEHVNQTLKKLDITEKLTTIPQK